MTETAAPPALATAHRLLEQAAAAVCAVVESGSDDELVSLLTVCEGAARRLDRAVVDAVAVLERRGTFTERGYRSTAGALRDLLGWEHGEARRRVVAAEQVTARVGLDGATRPARLPATAAVFAAGAAGVRHVDVIARVLGSAAAQRLTPEQWAGVEEQLAAKADCYTPSELHTWGVALVELLDQDGERPDDEPQVAVNELVLRRFRDGGGTLTGRFEDAAMFDTIATLIDAKAKPVTGDDHRPAGQRQAEALAEVCGYVLTHGDVPECGGHRPHVNVLIRLEDLEKRGDETGAYRRSGASVVGSPVSSLRRARTACLDFGGVASPQALRMLCCDAAVVPIVLNGQGQPLDVGRSTRTIPDGLRRAVAARDQGCAHPGCDRPPSWTECHHIIPWERGGETKLSNLVMVCKVHHRQLHFSEWIVRIRDGLPEFIPPKWVDHSQTPRRKALPHLLGVARR